MLASTIFSSVFALASLVAASPLPFARYKLCAANKYSFMNKTLAKLNHTVVLDDSVCSAVIVNGSFFAGYNWTLANVTELNLTAGNWSAANWSLPDNQTVAVNVTCFINGTIANVTLANSTSLEKPNASATSTELSTNAAAVIPAEDGAGASSSDPAADSGAVQEDAAAAAATVVPSSDPTAAAAVMTSSDPATDSGSVQGAAAAPTTVVPSSDPATDNGVAQNGGAQKDVVQNGGAQMDAASSVSTTTSEASSATPESTPASASPNEASGGSQLSNSIISGQHSGQATFYATGLGACGITNVDTDMIVAISTTLFDAFTPNGNPNANPLCMQTISISLGGNTIQVAITDRCVGCAEFDLDFSPTAFQMLVAGITQNSNTGLGIGRASGISWSLN